MTCLATEVQHGMSRPCCATMQATPKGQPALSGCRYILANVEHTSGVRRGDRVWQLGFGGGFKANSAVWRARRAIHSEHPCWL